VVLGAGVAVKTSSDWDWSGSSSIWHCAVMRPISGCRSSFCSVYRTPISWSAHGVFGWLSATTGKR
jgi:hypothetical protein